MASPGKSRQMGEMMVWPASPHVRWAKTVGSERQSMTSRSSSTSSSSTSSIDDDKDIQAHRVTPQQILTPASPSSKEPHVILYNPVKGSMNVVEKSSLQNVPNGVHKAPLPSSGNTVDIWDYSSKATFPIDISKIGFLWNLQRKMGRDCNELYIVKRTRDELPQPTWHQAGKDPNVRW